MRKLLPWCLLLAWSPLNTAQTEAVDIYYDAHSIAHVFGESDEAALFGLGYHQVREFPIGTLDRLWRFSGRYSEIVGPSYLDQDYRVRLWEIPELVSRDRQAVAPDIMRLLEAYAQGIEAGRVWWRNGNSPPTSGLRLGALLGTTADPTNVELNVDPLPDYLNAGFHSYAFDPDNPGGTHPGYDPADVHLYIARVVDRMFAPSNPITVDHVLALGLAFGSSPSLLYTASELSPRSEGDPPNTKGWAISSHATGGGVRTVTDPHTSRESLTNRPYLVQIHGDTMQITGSIMPGFPAPFTGFNEWISWTGAALVGRAVVQTTWETELESGPGPLRFRYGARLQPPKLARTGAAGPTEKQSADIRLERLQIVPDTIAYFDPVAVAARTQNRARYYVRDHDGLGLPRDRFPVVTVEGEAVDGLTVVPTPGDTIRFKQHSFTTGANTWEFFIRLARSRYIDDAPGNEEQVSDVLNDGLWSWGNGLIFADYKDRFHSVYMAHVPIQGPDVARTLSLEDYPGLDTGEVVLDGSLPGHRWRGFYAPSEMPRIGPVDVTGPEVWLSMVSTLDHVEVGPLLSDPNDDRFTADDLETFAPEITRRPTKSNFAALRAREVLMQGNLMPGALAGVTEDAAVDWTDAWMVTLWDFFKQARDIKVVELGPQPDVDRLIAFIEAYRHLTDDGLTCDPSVDFVAHQLSLVTPWTTQLQSRYLNQIGQQAGLTRLQSTLGFEALHPLHDLGAASMTRPAFDPNIEAMWTALTETTAIWQNGTGTQGLQNHDILVNQWLLSPWSSSPRFNDTQAAVDTLVCGPNSFDTDMAGTAAVRWGEINLLVLTPHYIPPGRAFQFDSNTDFIRSNLYLALRPDLLATLDLGGTNSLLNRLKTPVYVNQPVLAFPMGGTTDTMLPSQSPGVFTPSMPRGYSEAWYRWDTAPDNSLYYVPHERGAQVLLHVELSNPPGNAQARFLSATSATEITRPFQAYQDRFATSADFSTRTWNDLETDETTLAATAAQHLQLTYTPAP